MTLQEFTNQFETIKDAAMDLGVPYSTMRRWLKGTRPVTAWQRWMEKRDIKWEPPHRSRTKTE